MSLPMTTASMKDYFDKCNLDESSKPPRLEEETP